MCKPCIELTVLIHINHGKCTQRQTIFTSAPLPAQLTQPRRRSVSTRQHLHPACGAGVCVSWFGRYWSRSLAFSISFINVCTCGLFSASFSILVILGGYLYDGFFFLATKAYANQILRRNGCDRGGILSST